MGFLVVILLVALWAGILLPGAIRAHRSASPLNSVDNFERSMVMLAPTRSSPGRRVLVLRQPRALGERPGRARVMHRRRVALATLAGAVVLTALTGIIVGGGAWAFFLLALAALASYLVLLVQLRTSHQRRRATVRRLPVQPHAAGADRPAPGADRPSRRRAV